MNLCLKRLGLSFDYLTVSIRIPKLSALNKAGSESGRVYYARDGVGDPTTMGRLLSR